MQWRHWMLIGILLAVGTGGGLALASSFLASSSALEAPHSSPTHLFPPPSRTIWLLAAAHFPAVVANRHVRALFHQGVVYEPLSVRQMPNTAVAVIPTLDFHSEALLAAAVNAPGFPHHIHAVIYDNERFANTPQTEQHHIAQYTAKAAAVADTHHLQSICDFILPDRLPPNQRTPQNEVPACSIIGLNTVQQSERNPNQYQRIVQRDVSIIRAIRPQALIIAGLSANPRGAPVTASALTADMKAVAPWVNGFWLNVPAPGIGCPQCHAPDPALLTQALAALPATFHTGTAVPSSRSLQRSRSQTKLNASATPFKMPRILMASSGVIQLAHEWSWPATTRLLNTPSTYLIVSSRPHGVITHWSHIHQVGDATSLAQVRQRLAEGFHYILYDPEHWPFTPVVEQEHPVAAIRKAETLVHGRAHLIVAPALDLMEGPTSHESRTQKMLASGIYAAAATAWGVDIQAQGLEADPTRYTLFVTQVLHQYTSATIHPTIFVGLSTNPSGHRVTAAQLITVWHQVSPLVQGFWMNIPGHGPACPRCGVPHPAVAQAFFHTLFPVLP